MTVLHEVERLDRATTLPGISRSVRAVTRNGCTVQEY